LNILFITANRLGDAVLSTGALAALNRTASVRADHRCLRSAGARRVRRGATVVNVISLSSSRCTVIGAGYGCKPSVSPGIWCRPAQYSGQPDAAQRKLKVFRGLKPRQHMVEGLAELIAQMFTRPRPPVAEQRVAEQVGRERSGGERILALAPGAHGFGKRWPAERYAHWRRLCSNR